MYSNRRPYYGLKLSIADFFREPVRYLKQSNTQESMMEKPYLVGEYPKMHLSIPDFKYKPKKRSGFFGQIADGVLPGGLAFIDYGEARCYWNAPSTSYCVEGPVVITLGAEYFWGEDFEFNIGISGDTRDVGIKKLPETEGGAWDTQDYLFTFPENYNGIISICGYASTHTLVSQTFETKVAGMPVSLLFIGGGIVLREKGQENPAKLIGSSYGIKGASCGCIEIESSCYPDDPGSIGYTTQQMSTDEVQNLTVTDPNPDYTYSWSISSGGGTLSSSTGTSVDYTAPSENADCENNPIITLMVGGVPVDSLSLAVNDTEMLGLAYKVLECRTGSNGHCVTYRCNDTIATEPLCCISDPCISDCPGLTGWPIIPEDIRTEGQIAAGCCPAGLL